MDRTHPHHPCNVRPTLDVDELLSFLPPLISAYKQVDGVEPPLTTKVLEFEGTIDYVFVRCDRPRERRCPRAPGLDSRHCGCRSDDVEVRSIRPLPFDAASVHSFPPIPTADIPSDHLPLGCAIKF